MIFSSEEELVRQTTDISIKNLSAQEKLIMFIFYGAVAIAFSIVVFFIIKTLKEVNIKRGTFRCESNYKRIDYKKTDNVFNIPFFAIIIIYLICMFLPRILMSIL